MRWTRLVAGALCAAALVACDDGGAGFVPPPGSCEPGDRRCYHEPVSDREYVLRCNDGEVDGAIWIIDEVCLGGALCADAACDYGPGGAP